MKASPALSVPIAYPVRVNLLYADYEPFGNQSTRCYSGIYYYGTLEEALQAETWFIDAARPAFKKEDQELVEVFQEFPDGVVYAGDLNRLSEIEYDLAYQKTGWLEASCRDELEYERELMEEEMEDEEREESENIK